MKKNKLISENRIGRFYISENLIKTENVHYDIFSKVIIIKCEYIFHNKIFEYMGYSKLFDQIEPGHKVPKYIFSVKYNGQVIAERLHE